MSINSVISRQAHNSDMSTRFVGQGKENEELVQAIL